MTALTTEGVAGAGSVAPGDAGPRRAAPRRRLALGGASPSWACIPA